MGNAVNIQPFDFMTFLNIARLPCDNIDEAFAMLALSYNALSVTMSGR
jgi:hypothetical protein